MKQNNLEKFLEKVNGGHMAYGCCITSSDESATEIACAAGFDFVWIDGEHGQMDRNTAMRHLAKVKGTDVASFYRVPSCDHTEIKKVTSASAYSDLERRFGPWARLYASGCFLVMQSVRSGMILFLLALLLRTMFGLSFLTCILVTGVTTVVYSMLGGLNAVVWTDAIQSVILIVGTVVVVAILCCTLPQGVGTGLLQAWDAGKFSLGSLSLKDWGCETFWVTFVDGRCTGNLYEVSHRATALTC